MTNEVEVPPRIIARPNVEPEVAGRPDAEQRLQGGPRRHPDEEQDRSGHDEHHEDETDFRWDEPCQITGERAFRLRPRFISGGGRGQGVLDRLTRLDDQLHGFRHLHAADAGDWRRRMRDLDV